MIDQHSADRLAFRVRGKAGLQSEPRDRLGGPPLAIGLRDIRRVPSHDAHGREVRKGIFPDKDERQRVLVKQAEMIPLGEGVADVLPVGCKRLWTAYLLLV